MAMCRQRSTYAHAMYASKANLQVVHFRLERNFFFNYDSDEETSGSESDKEFECEDITDNEEDTVKENKIRADCVADAVEPCSYIVLYSSPESFEMFYSAIL